MKINQIGFRKGFETADLVLTIKTVMDKYLRNNKKLYFCVVDFRKAFDSIWLEALFKKLLGYGVSAKFVSLLRNMYKKIKLSVQLPRGISEVFPSNVKLKQGCNMSPILFNLFINDINEIFDVCFCHPVTLGIIKLSNLLYADDLILISETKTGLQSCLDQSASITARSGNSWSTIKRQKSWLWKKDNPQLEPLEICKLYP